MTAHEYDCMHFFGVGIPEEPDEDNIKPVLASLHIGTKAKWSGVTDNKTCSFVDWLRWNDGYQPRFRGYRP